MKREILFRAKRIDNGELAFGQLVFDAIGKDTVVIGNIHDKIEKP